MKRIHPTTSSPVVTRDLLSDDNFENDVLFRVRTGNECNTFTITSTSTRTVRDNLDACFVQHSQDINLLCSVIFWQKRTIDYQALHKAFLLNSLSEEEFEKEAEKFTVHQEKVPFEKIANTIERLDSLVEIKFDTSDYSDYFQCSQENVMAGLRLLPYPRFTAMLPALAENDISRSE
jgi:hypothetical protein